MNITVIYASGRKTRSSTYQIAQMLIKELLEDETCFSFFISLRWYSVFFQQIGLMLKMTLRNIFRTAPRQGAVLQ